MALQGFVSGAWVEAKPFDKFFRFVKYNNVFSQLRRLKQFMQSGPKCVDGGYMVG